MTESIIDCGEELRIQKCKSFLRDGFYIKVIKIFNENGKKPLYMFSICQDEDFLLGEIEFKALSLKLAIKKLDNWLIYNFPKDRELDLPYQYDNDRFNYSIVKRGYIDSVIRECGDSIYKFCPKCGTKTHQERKFCKECEYIFFK